MLHFIFNDVKYDIKEIFLAKKQEIGEAIKYLQFALNVLKDTKNALDAEKIIYQKSIDDGVKANNVFMPLRVAITSSSVSPPLFESINLMDRKKVLSRIERAIDFLSK